MRVWAPYAGRVDLVVHGSRSPMNSAGGGWFEATDGIAPGDDYGFSLDGGDPLPDPRSGWQPRGVDGPSRLVDHDRFPWSDGGWRPAPWRDAIVYELHVGTYSPEGTFDSAIERLDHVVRLGATAVELMPVAEFSGDRGWGYDGVDLFAPHHAYGGPDGLKRLVDACHARGLSVIVDVVYNHLGPAGNYLGRFGPYFTDRYNTPWGDAVNFDDAGSHEVRRFFIDNALMWIRDYHFDGLRIDAIHAIFDRSAVHFLEQLNDEVKQLADELGRNAYVIAESDLNDPRVVRAVSEGGFGLDAQWSDDLHHALHAYLTGERIGYYADFGRLADIDKAAHDAFVYDGRYSAYRDRIHGRPTTGLSGHSFVGFLQNHDQVGNRATGERISAMVPVGLLKVAAALVITSPFVPMLFMGEEWAATTPFLYFTAHRDPDLGRAVSEGRRHEFAAFGWEPSEVPDPQDLSSFERSKLPWAELEDHPHADLLDWYRPLIQLRKQHPSLTDGRMDRVVTRFEESLGWLVVERGPITVACNFSSQPRSAPVPSDRSGEVLLTSDKAPAVSSDAVELPPESVTIFSTPTASFRG